MTAAQDSRAQFEEFYEADAMPAEADWFRRDPNDISEYLHEDTIDAWKFWQASRAALSAEPVDDGFELWWADHMPKATQSEAWAAWVELHSEAPQPAAQERKPLTDAQISEYVERADVQGSYAVPFARGVRWGIRHYERAHGITGE